ncbi:MAG: basic amino acid/polyamine antiporter, family [Sphingomonadales bacterium]|jgi:APA family basic amino acid/polyamine antiporter|nr:basic amino acid/polyamine antiporter, family [Sphingomonadales bacterium]MEA3036257.1 basic amino acid/polyamine antiporter, family [Sphingomonadales bacterium]
MASAAPRGRGFGRVKPLDAILATAEKKGLKRSLGAFQLTLLGIGAVIGTGIFVLTATAAQKAGPGMMISFIIAGAVCAVAALCYAELASMVPVAGSAYTYSYAVMGEMVAWLVGWALILEYALGASAVAVGWSGHIVGLLDSIGLHLPHALTVGPKISVGNFLSGGEVGGLINLPAVIITALVTTLLVIGTKESATFNAVLVIIKVSALTLFVIVTVPMISGHAAHYHPFTPRGWGSPLSSSGVGVLGAAASIFFAYVGFDAVSTAAEETKNPQKNVPIGLIGSLLICTIFYLLVAGGAIGAYGAQPLIGPDGIPFKEGSPELYASAACQAAHAPLVCSKEALAHIMREVSTPWLGNIIGLAATIALPSVVLLMMYGQTRIFFVMARDGLLPAKLSTVHPRFRTPWIVTIVTGIFVAIAAAFFPVGQLADYSNAGTLFAFAAVSVGVMVLRYTDPRRVRPFRTPLVFIVAPASILGCILLFASLGIESKMLFLIWTAIGLVVYFLYGFHQSHLGRGIVEVHEPEAYEETEPPIPGTH